MKELVKS